LAGRRQAEPSLGGGGLARHRGLYPAQQLTENPVAEWTMSPSVAFQITNELQSLHWDKSLESLTTFMSDSKKIVSSHLQKEDHLWQMLKDLHNETSPTSAVVLKNLAIDPVIPKTPTDGSKSLQKQTFVAEAMLLSLGELSGAKVVGYSAEKEYSNPWVHEGFPRDGVGSALTAPAELSYHQDMSYQESIPDILGLYCLREGHDTDVFTTLVDVREIIAQLPSDVVSILRQERFQIRTSDWVDASSVQVQQGRAILDGFSLHLPVHWENMIGLDEDAKTALALLQEAIIAAEPHKVHFEPGMLVFFNNQRVVHGRTPYTDLRFDGGDRVLNRAYFRRELSPQEEVTRMI
jgi:L-asparagine oxygenase